MIRVVPFRFFAFALVATAFVAVPADADDSSGVASLPEAMATAVDALDSPNWNERDRAEFELQGVEPVWAGVFRRLARRGASIEAALRLRRAAEELFVSERIGPSRAFLGISHYPVDWERDPRIAPGYAAMRINHTIPDSQAERARLQRDDLIIAVDGVVPRSLEQATAMSQLIGNHKPGDPCKFVILRGIEGFHINSKSVNGFDLRQLRDLPTQVISSDIDPRLPPGAFGLRVSGEPGADAPFGLMVGDVIIGLDGRPIPAEDSRAAFEAWCDTADRDVDRPVRRRPRLILEPSIQVIRGGRRIVVEVPLGRVPLDVAAQDNRNPPGQPLRGASPERIRELRRDFDRWWSMPDSDADSPPTRLMDAALFWQMNP